MVSVCSFSSRSCWASAMITIENGCQYPLWFIIGIHLQLSNCRPLMVEAVLIGRRGHPRARYTLAERTLFYLCILVSVLFHLALTFF